MALDAVSLMRARVRGTPSWPGHDPETGYVGADRSDHSQKLLADGAGHTFLEPETGLAWYENGTRKLELVIGVQSPHQAAASVAALLSKNTPASAVHKIVAYCADVGGAFGGKDHTIYPLYVALAALFSPGRPVRLANDRFDQFQFG